MNRTALRTGDVTEFSNLSSQELRKFSLSLKIYTKFARSTKLMSSVLIGSRLEVTALHKGSVRATHPANQGWNLRAPKVFYPTNEVNELNVQCSAKS